MNDAARWWLSGALSVLALEVLGMAVLHEAILRWRPKGDEDRGPASLPVPLPGRYRGEARDLRGLSHHEKNMARASNGLERPAALKAVEGGR